MLAGIALGGLIVLRSMSGAPQDAKTMTVFVSEGPTPEYKEGTRAEKDAHEATLKDLRAKWKDMEKGLKAQHGSKRKNWPEDAELQMLQAEEAIFLEMSEWDYRHTKPESLSDSVQDVKDALVGKGIAAKREHIALASSREDAQLVVEIDGRRSDRKWTLNPADDDFYVRVRISRGPKLPEAQFAAVPPMYRYRTAGVDIMRLGIAGPSTPYWRFESHGMMSWHMAGSGVANLVDDFINRNYDAMMAAVQK
jgi:hypothetical protein